MSNVEFDTNIEDVFDRFKKLSSKEMGRALRSGIRKGALLIRNQARKRFRSLFPVRRNPRYTDILTDGIRATKVKERNKELTGYVLITPTRRAGSGSYRLIFLEGGTAERVTKRGYRRGRIEASYFFTSTISANQEAYKVTVVNEINKTMNKISVR